MRTAVLIGAAGLVLSGCASIPEQRSDDLPDGKPAVTDDQAAQAMNHIDELTNAASAERDHEPLEAIVSEPILETSQTSFALAEAREDESSEPYFHTNVSGHSPRFTEYPMWFVSTSTIDNDPGRVSVEVFARDSATSEWVVEQTAGLGAVELPDLAVDASAVGTATEDQSALVDDVVTQVVGYLEGGDTEGDLNLEAFDNYREWVEGSTIDEEQVTSPKVSCERDERVELRVLPTGDGAFGVVTVLCTITQQIEETIDATMSLGGELAALAPDAGRRVEFVSSHPVVTAVSEDGWADVFSGGWRWADVTMHEE